jgi:hypothetical protein
MNPEEWKLLCEVGGQNKPKVTRAITYIRSWDSACRAVHVGCDDGNDYIVKGSQVGRSAFNDQVVGRIAWELGAPVALVSLVNVEPDLVANNPEMAHVRSGTAHGSLFVPDCTECAWFQFVDLRENRPRFALLSVLYGWMVGAEKQFFYSITPPHLVNSFDHDAFFPNGPNWSAESLSGAPYPDVDEVIVDQCGLRHRELNDACVYLQKMTPETIALAIASVPAEWGAVDEAQRLALAQYLWERCETMRS